MITENIAVMKNAKTEGFEVSTSSLSVEVSKGSISFFEAIRNDDFPEEPPKTFKEIKHEFDAFSFEIEPDDASDGLLVDVIYDVYLILRNGSPTIELFRTELGPYNDALYIPEDGDTILHSLMSIAISPNAETAEEARGNITKIQREDA